MDYAERFEDLEIWQEARRLNQKAYQLTAKRHEYFFVNQWNRSAMSMMNNIAEGFERRTNIRNSYEVLAKRIAAFQRHL